MRACTHTHAHTCTHTHTHTHTPFRFIPDILLVLATLWFSLLTFVDIVLHYKARLVAKEELEEVCACV